MKNIINFYYQMNIENLHLSNGVYYFIDGKDSYMFVPFHKNLQLLPSLYILNQNLCQRNPYYYRIILNKEGFPYIIVDNQCFCLLKSSRVVHDTMSFFDLPFDLVPLESSTDALIRFPWSSFWIPKIDYLESIIVHLEKSYQKILPILLYFLGLAENAIQYVNTTVTKIAKTEKDKIVVCHHRIDAHYSVANLYMPLDLVLDYPARDVAEYLKSLFFYNEYDFSEIEEYLMSLDFSEFGYSLLFGRMLYPSFFFDLWDDVLNEKKEYQDFLWLGERREEYRIFLKEIYYIIRKKASIEEVRWILRN